MEDVIDKFNKSILAEAVDVNYIYNLLKKQTKYKEII